MQKTILIVDDDREMAGLLSRYLSNHGFPALAAYNGTEGLAVLEETKPALIVTDVEMPGLDGLALCRKLRENRATASIPVVIMSGKKVTESDQLSGYTGGADDYVIKPFSFAVLLAKIKVLLRKAKEAPLPKAAKIRRRGFELDMDGRALKVAGRPVRVTAKEFDLFTALTSRPGRVLSVNQLIENVWGFDPADYNDPHTVEVHISNLRKKLGPRLSSRIKAVAGHGYKFE